MASICILERTVQDVRTTDGGHLITMGDDDVLAGKSEEKRPFGKKQMGGQYYNGSYRDWEYAEGIHLAKGRGKCRALANMALNVWVP